MTTFPTGVASKPANITDGLQILATHVGSAWDEIIGLESELLGTGAGSFVMDLRPSAAGSVIFQLRQTSGDTQARFQLTGNGDLRWGPGTATQDVTLARTATRTVTLTGTEIITPGNSADKGLLIKGVASQSGLLFEVQDSTATSKFSITAAGVVTALTLNASTALTAPTLSPGTSTTGVATTAFVSAAVVAGTPSGIPAGVMAPYAGTAAPSGWMLCDGSAVSRATFSALFTALGTAFGAGDGSTTFNVPDTRSRSLMGVGTGAGLTARALAATGGTETVTLDNTMLPSHNHGAVTGSTTPGSISSASTIATGSIGVVGDHQHGAGLGVDEGVTYTMAAGGSTNNSGRFSYANTGGSGVTTTSYTGPESDALGLTDGAGSHNHAFSGIGHTHSVPGSAHTHVVSSQGANGPVPNIHPWLATNFIIKT